MSQPPSPSPSASPPLSMRDLLAPHAVLDAPAATLKKDLLHKLADFAAGANGVTPQGVFDCLWEREKLGSTGIGQGIAVPHGRVPGLNGVRGIFARLTQPVPFDAVDDKPVDLVFVLLAPQDAGADHLNALALVSRTLRDKELCARVRKAGNAAAIYTLLTA